MILIIYIIYLYAATPTHSHGRCIFKYKHSLSRLFKESREEPHNCRKCLLKCVLVRLDMRNYKSQR